MAVCVVRGTENFNGQIKAFHWATVTPITLLHPSLRLFPSQQTSHASVCAAGSSQLLLLAMLLQAVLAPPPGWEGGGPPAQIAPAED